ncbi:MAG: SGNH/GDSL hydrolase family protein [Candidatus Levybacteria bacterium]|nr:SGNH/GDSL hydrolase family protein [Candidatus Levybacteria bacterium]
MKTKLLVLFFSTLISLMIGEVILQVSGIVPEVNKNYKRKDLEWTEKNVVLNAAGYRAREYPKDRTEDTFRIYALGDSFTFGWLVDNPNDVYTAIIEKELGKKLSKKIEVINAASPGFSIKESVRRYMDEGKFYHPDLILFGINSRRVNVVNPFIATIDIPFLPGFIKKTALYQATIGNLLRKQAEDKNYKLLVEIFRNEHSQDWNSFSELMISLKGNAEKINAKLAFILFPYINAKNPNESYGLRVYNDRFKEFGKKNGIIIIDPYEDFLKYKNKENLVINPLDAHPTPDMNMIMANAFLRQFDAEKYIKSHIPFSPKMETVRISADNMNIGKYEKIRKISSSDSAPYVYFETGKDFENGTQDLPLEEISSRQTQIYNDRLQTVENFTADNVIGASILYYIYPQRPGKIVIPQKIYGYEIAGFENAFGIYKEGNGVASVYIDPVSIIKENGNYTITYDPIKPFYVFRLSLPIRIRQLDIDQNGEIKNITQTVQLEKILTKNSKSVVFSSVRKISGTPQFFADKNIYSYAFVDNNLEKLEKVEVNENTITLSFTKEIKEGKKIMFPILTSYTLSENETIEIEIER